jgi:hypothetical protein
VSVDFSSLDIIVNVESWVVILRCFFGLGPDSAAGEQKTRGSPQSVPAEKTASDTGNMNRDTYWYT